MILEHKAKELFQKWNNALQTNNKEEVAKLYTDDDAFLPTLSKDFKKGVDGTENYFEHFLKKNPFVKITIEDVRGDENNIIHSGFYNFEVDDGQGERENIKARFTFVYKKCTDGEYKISHHHSSLKPVNS